MTSNKIKGFKVTNCDRSRTCGIACKDLAELVKKASVKLQVEEKGCLLYLSDGTIVDDEDYFSTLPQQTCFVLLNRGQQLLTGADIIYNALKCVNLETLKTGLAAKEFFQDNVKEKVVVLSKLIARSEDTRDSTQLSSRLQHPDWFLGLDTGAKTKEQFMRRRCSERMRGYLYKADKDIKSHPSYPEMQHSADRAVYNLKKLLSEKDNMGHYFDRSDSTALCDSDGKFNCHGLWNRNTCESFNDHVINPYSSREERIIFSTWNLDHRIEKSREIIPSLIMACRNEVIDPERFTINIPYFFSLLFTNNNLRLVHIVCHDKGSHSTAKCDPCRIYIPTDTTSRGTKRKVDILLEEDFNISTAVNV